MNRIVRPDKTPRRTAHDMILEMVKFSNYGSGRFWTDADIKRYLQSLGYDFDDLVKRCMENYNMPIPTENLLGSTWRLTGGTATSISPTGKELFSVSGSGELTQKAYWGCYEESQKQLKECISDQSYIKFQSALVLGIAAIEAYINYRAGIWNETHPNERLVDSKENKVSFDQKIDEWIPVMTNQKKLDKGNRNWQEFRYLRDIRDNTTIHMKQSGYGISYKDLADLINRYSYGISGILIQLHKLFNEMIPPIIIRNFYAPPVKIIDEGE